MLLWLIERLPPPTDTDGRPADVQEQGHILGFQTKLSVGRRESDLIVNDPSVSRSHAIFHMRNGGLFLDDSHSKFGTFVNDTRLSGETELHDGDKIQFGACERSLWRCTRFPFTPFLGYDRAPSAAKLGPHSDIEAVASAKSPKEATHFIYDETRVKLSACLAHALCGGLILWTKGQLEDAIQGIWRPARHDAASMSLAGHDDGPLKGHLMDLSRSGLSLESRKFLTCLIKSLGGELLPRADLPSDDSGGTSGPTQVVSLELEALFLSLACGQPLPSKVIAITLVAPAASPIRKDWRSEVAMGVTPPPVVNYKRFQKTHVRSRMPQIIAMSVMKLSTGEPPVAKENWLTPPPSGLEKGGPANKKAPKRILVNDDALPDRRFKSALFAALERSQ